MLEFVLTNLAAIVSFCLGGLTTAFIVGVKTSKLESRVEALEKEHDRLKNDDLRDIKDAMTEMRNDIKQLLSRN